LNGGFGQGGIGFDNMGVWNGAKSGAVSLQAMATTTATPAIPANPTPAAIPGIPAIDPVLAAKMAQL
jgi:hypothetical protein